jgi:hypothetical protein
VWHILAIALNWEVNGAPQVPAIAKSDKHQFTLMVAITTSGMMLPWQEIYKGKTVSGCLPAQDACNPWEKLILHVMPCGGKHWSTLKRMKMVSQFPLLTFELIDTLCCIYSSNTNT